MPDQSELPLIQIIFLNTSEKELLNPPEIPVIEVIFDGEIVPSSSSELLKLRVTFPVGSLLSATVKVSVPPASVVANPSTGSIIIPAVSSFILNNR